MAIPRSYTNITKSYYGGQENYYFYPTSKQLIEVINILVSAGVTTQKKSSKIINILVRGNVFANKNISTTVNIVAKAIANNQNINISDQWILVNNGESIPGDGPVIYDSTPVDYTKSNYDLGEDTIPNQMECTETKNSSQSCNQ